MAREFFRGFLFFPLTAALHGLKRFLLHGMLGWEMLRRGPTSGLIPDPTTQTPQVSSPQCPHLRFITSITCCLQTGPPSRGGSVPRARASPAMLPPLQAAGGGPASPAGPGGGDATPGAPEGDAGHGGRFQQRSRPPPGPARCPGNQVSEAVGPGWEGGADAPFCEDDQLIPVSPGLSWP